MSANQLMSAKRLLLELEEKIPWSAVKKKWTPKRQSWLNSVEHAGTTAAVAKRLCMLEAALKQESLDDSWVTLKDAWRSTLAESPSSERILEAVARLEGAILWDRVREESLELSRRIDLAQAQQAQHTQQQQQPLKQEPQLAGAEAVLGSPDAPPVRVRVPHRAGAGLGKRPRLLMGAGGGAGGGSAAGGGGSACCAGAYSSASGQELCSRASLFELCARGDADWEHVLAEAPVPTREQLLSGPAAERVPAAALRMLALLESAGLGGRHEGAVVTQLLELVHRHAASILADAHDCCVHRADARDPSAPGLGGARLCAQDVRMAVEMDVIVLAQAAPPPREYLASSGCGAINAMPLPLLPDGGLGVALPRRADCLASLHR